MPFIEICQVGNEKPLDFSNGLSYLDRCFFRRCDCNIINYKHYGLFVNRQFLQKEKAGILRFSPLSGAPTLLVPMGILTQTVLSCQALITNSFSIHCSRKLSISCIHLGVVAIGSGIQGKYRHRPF